MDNCWEYLKCGREPGGPHVSDKGVCPAATDVKDNNTNRGKNAGRYCWKIAGTLCGGQIQGDSAKKLMSCSTCDFYQLVKKEEGAKFIS